MEKERYQNGLIEAGRDKVNILCFCALLLFFAAIIVLAPADTKVGAMEHRSLNEAPELSLRTALNGEFSRLFEEFIADQISFRSNFIMMSKGIERAYGITLTDEPMVINIPARARDYSRERTDAPGRAGAPESAGLTGPASAGTTDEFAGATAGPARVETGSADTADGSTGAAESFDVSAVSSGSGAQWQGRDFADGGASHAGEYAEAGAKDAEPVRAGPLLAFPDRLVELYGYGERACIRYAEAINSYAKALAGKARVFSLIAPTQIEFIDEKYRHMSDSEFDAMMIVYGRLENVSPVDAYSYINAHSGEYVYFRTDHHWTALGAYYAYLAFCDAAGIEPVRKDEYDSYELPGFLGYLYSIHPVKELKENPDTIIYYELKAPIEVSDRLIYKPGAGGVTYSIFIGGDSPVYKVTTSVKNGRTCAVIKDSYGNAFVPWLAPNYETIIVFDPRKFNGSVTQTLAEYDDIDLIILNSAFTVGSGGFNSLISGIL